jgi:predicted NBD/HSP70 family sugar kinase
MSILYYIVLGMYISIDMGGTNTRIAGAHDIDNPTFIGQPVRHRNSQTYEADLQFMIDTIQEVAGGERIAAIGIGTPGTPNSDRTQIASAIHIPYWENKPLVEPLANSFGCPVYYHNDAVVAGLGEAYYGSRPQHDFHYLIWGTGIGGAAIQHLERGGLAATKLIWKTHFQAWSADCAGAEVTKRFSKSPENFSEAEWATVLKACERHLLSYIETHQPPAVIFGGGLAVRHRQMLLGLNQTSSTPIGLTSFDEDSGIMGGFGLIRHAQSVLG